MNSNGWPGGGMPQSPQWPGSVGGQPTAQGQPPIPGQPSSYQYPASYPAQMPPQQYYSLPPQQPAPKKWLPWLLGSLVAIVVIAVVATTVIVLRGEKNNETVSPQSSSSASPASLPTGPSPEATFTTEPSETPTKQSDPVTPTPTPTTSTPTPTNQSTAAEQEYKDVDMPKQVGKFSLVTNESGLFSYAKDARGSQIIGLVSSVPSDPADDANLGSNLANPEKVADGKAICGGLEDGMFLCYSTSEAFSGSLMVYGYSDKGLTYAELKSFMTELFKKLK